VRRAAANAIRRGFSLPEMLAALTMLAFVMLGAATLLNVGRRQQQALRIYSQVQTDLRGGIRRATRTLRHARQVLNPSSVANFPVKVSNASQVIVEVPEPTGSASTTVQVRFYASDGVFYAQRSDVAGAGVGLERNVQSVAFNYFRTNNGARSAVDSAPDQATEIQITLTANSGAINTRLSSLVALRNVLISR
jgi:prepilin-type N-terminal cleavage/methylation domain-containing protein